MKPLISSCLFTCPSPTGKSCCSFHSANTCKLTSFPKRSAPCEIFLTSYFFFNALFPCWNLRVLQPCTAVWDYGIMSGKSAAAAAAKLLQSCPTLCDHINGLLPGSSVPGILQARTLEWVAISFSNAWKWKVKVKSLSCVRLSDLMDCSLPGCSVHGIFQARVLEWGAIAFSGLVSLENSKEVRSAVKNPPALQETRETRFCS